PPGQPHLLPGTDGAVLLPARAGRDDRPKEVDDQQPPPPACLIYRFALAPRARTDPSIPHRRQNLSRRRPARFRILAAFPDPGRPAPIPFDGQGGSHMADSNAGKGGVLFGWLKAAITSVAGLVGGA